jgi:hypothetical protein
MLQLLTASRYDFIGNHGLNVTESLSTPKVQVQGFACNWVRLFLWFLEALDPVACSKAVKWFSTRSQCWCWVSSWFGISPAGVRRLCLGAIRMTWHAWDNKDDMEAPSWRQKGGRPDFWENAGLQKLRHVGSLHGLDGFLLIYLRSIWSSEKAGQNSGCAQDWVLQSQPSLMRPYTPKFGQIAGGKHWRWWPD